MVILFLPFLAKVLCPVLFLSTWLICLGELLFLMCDDGENLSDAFVHEKIAANDCDGKYIR